MRPEASALPARRDGDVPATLVFDLGGVVFRWRPDEFLPRLLPNHATDPAATRELITRFFEGFGGDWADFDRGRIEPAPLADRVAARTGIRLGEVRRVIDAIPDELQPLPDTEAWLRRLKVAGHRLVFLSNMPVPYARHLESTHSVLGLFERGVFSSRIGMVKPEPALFSHAATVFERVPSSLLLLDDNEANVNAAIGLGWAAIRFENAVQAERDLAAAARAGSIDLG
ncbi:MAG: HAD family phosphatase [Caldimonas sp.]